MRSTVDGVLTQAGPVLESLGLTSMLGPLVATGIGLVAGLSLSGSI